MKLISGLQCIGAAGYFRPQTSSDHFHKKTIYSLLGGVCFQISWACLGLKSGELCCHLHEVLSLPQGVCFCSLLLLALPDISEHWVFGSFTGGVDGLGFGAVEHHRAQEMLRHVLGVWGSGSWPYLGSWNTAYGSMLSDVLKGMGVWFLNMSGTLEHCVKDRVAGCI